jgi:hypothetical protein
LLKFDAPLGGINTRDCGAPASDGEGSIKVWFGCAGGAVFRLGAGVTGCSVAPGVMAGTPGFTGTGVMVAGAGTGTTVVAEADEQHAGPVEMAGAIVATGAVWQQGCATGIWVTTGRYVV